MIEIDSRFFKPYGIVLEDDALHRRGNLGRVETFYYDAIFENDYSAVALVNIFHLSKIGFVLISLSIYKDSKLIKNKRYRIPYKYLRGSEEKPYIKIKDQQIIEGHLDNITKSWIYHISMGNREYGIDLELITKGKGWKGKTYLGNWLAIPRFKIDGTIILDGKKTVVSGEGYHDHNIYPLYAPFINRGYYFGKIFAGSMTVTWARVMRNRNNVENIVVLNRDDKFLSIDPRYIQITTENLVKSHRKIIPTKFCLKVDCDSLHLNAKMEPINFHHIKIPTVNYWRYHVYNTGEIKTESCSKKINCVEFVEYLKFL